MAEGDPCQYDHECIPTHYCGDFGICVPPTSGGACTAAGFYECPPDEYCAPGTCTPFLNGGVGCAPFTFCGPGQQCVEGVRGGPTTIGDCSLGSDYRCPAGETCVNDTGARCVPLLSSGADCLMPTHGHPDPSPAGESCLATGLGASGNQCKQRAGGGESCSCNSDCVGGDRSGKLCMEPYSACTQ